MDLTYLYLQALIKINSMRQFLRLFSLFFWLGAYYAGQPAHAQTTFPVNGVANPQNGSYAFTNATIVKDAHTTIEGATLVIRNRKIVAVGKQVSIPKDAVVIDCSGKYIYPSFIDLYSNYGIDMPQRSAQGFNPFAGSQLTSATKGAVGWNQAMKPEVNAAELFQAVSKDAKNMRDAGFGSVLTHQHDGIARGTGSFVTLADLPDNLVMIKPQASAQYSFSRGTSTQSYPSSIMGVVALLRQTYLDAAWYKSSPAGEGKNLSLEAWNKIQDLPQIFEVGDKWASLRAYRIGNEFNVNYIIKAGGDEYQRMDDIAATKASFIVPLDFPKAMDVEDPNDARYVALADMKHWELAATNPAAFEKAHLNFSLTAFGLKDSKIFWSNLRKAIDAGLSEEAALDALTKNPATTLGVYDVTGSIETGKLANFFITNEPVFEEKSVILQNWVQGEKYDVNEEKWLDPSATYQVNMVQESTGNTQQYTLVVTGANAARMVSKDTLNTRFSFDGKLVTINFSPVAAARTRNANSQAGADSSKTAPLLSKAQQDSIAKIDREDDDQLPENQRKRALQQVGTASPRSAITGPLIRLSGLATGDTWQGTGIDTSGNMITWTATRIPGEQTAKKPVKKKATKETITGKVTYPFGAYGWTELPIQKDLLIKNATVWTSDKQGVLANTDVLVKNGKIAGIGKNLGAGGATIIDGTGKHLSAGIIDEHSHIAVFSINEGGQSVTSEVRIGDNLNPDDINIYRQLSGGVTTSHILHGSANTIGGQTQLIKLRWGADDEGLKFKGAAPFIKFALGENVKRTRSNNNNRFPNTRMGVEEVLNDAFTRAKDYEAALIQYQARGKNSKLLPVRKDLELDALVEIMNEQRFITCHSYIQSEITSAMRIGEKFGFRFNTFTHILEGYKVADKMKAHGANASTFSDWWIYKMEVTDAIAQNASIMHKMGVNVAINSDDAEMARRLNQEAAKSIRFGLSEEEALNMVTINPATMLHIQDRTGSITVGKDADLVLWSDKPVSIYAVAEKTIVDGIVYFDREHDKQLRKELQQERNRLMQKLAGEKKSGASMAPAFAAQQIELHCESEGDIYEENHSHE